jgi:hypothetical protein
VLLSAAGHIVGKLNVAGITQLLGTTKPSGHQSRCSRNEVCD